MHETMDKYDIDPSYIEVEVTESVMTEKTRRPEALHDRTGTDGIPHCH